jgi:hypothetical protein
MQNMKKSKFTQRGNPPTDSALPQYGGDDETHDEMMVNGGEVLAKELRVLATVRILRESPCGVVSSLVRCGRNVYWWVD